MKLEPLTEAATPTGISVVLEGGGYKRALQGQERPPRKKGLGGWGGEMEPKPGSQLRLPVAEDDLEPPAFYLTNAEIIGICCQ